MKIWLIYDSPYGNTQTIAEGLSDLLEDNFDMYVGNINKLSPEIIIDEKPENIIFGGPIYLLTSRLSIENWISNFSNLLNIHSYNEIKSIFAFFTSILEHNNTKKWDRILKKYFDIESVFPYILDVKIDGEINIFDILNNPLIYQFSRKIKSKIKKIKGRLNV